MMKVQEILSDPRVADLVQRNPQVADKVEKAAKILKNEQPDPVAAVLEAARALIDGKIRVFFSYKQQDEETAKSVVKELRLYAAGKLKIVFAAEFGEKIPGAKWNKMIREGIKKAHWFILLLPDPSVDWDWCLFETGMFRAKMVSDKVNRLICIHHPRQTALPPQIEEFQAVKAVPRSVEAMLKKIYINNDPIPGMDPISRDISETIPKIAKKIAKAVSPPIQQLKPTYLQRRVWIKVKDPESLTKPVEMEEAAVVDINTKALDIFGIESNVKTWGKLISRMATNGQDIRWLRELCDSIRNAAKGFSPDPIQATFKGLYGGKMWRPVLQTVYKTSEGSIDSFVILFIEESGSGPRNHIAEPVQALMTTLKFAYRFRWEIIERFKERITEDEVVEFQEILEQMDEEAKSRGIMDPEALCQNFDAASAKEIKEMFQKWNSARNEKRTGELDRAIQEKDVQSIERIITDMAPMNQRFIKLASERLEQISEI